MVALAVVVPVSVMVSDAVELALDGARRDLVEDRAEHGLRLREARPPDAAPVSGGAQVSGAAHVYRESGWTSPVR